MQTIITTNAAAGGQWALQALRLLDFPAGRYTQIRTSPVDGLPTIVWNGAGLRFSRCLDEACGSWTLPVTLPSTDPDPRFVRMEFARGLPVMTYGAVNDTELHLTRCEDQACSKLQTLVVARAQKVRHPGLSVIEESGKVIVAAELSNSTQKPIGCTLSVLEISLDPLALLRTTVVDHSTTPYIHTGVLPTGGFEMPCLIPAGGGTRVHLAYWKVESRELVLVFDVLTGGSGGSGGGGNASTAVVVDVGHNASSSPGAWTRGLAVDGTSLLLTWWDLGTGVLKLTRCQAAPPRRCAPPEALDHGGQLDLSDFGAGAFPDFRAPPPGAAGNAGPVLAYFSEANASGWRAAAGELRLLTCPDANCTHPAVVTAASGRAGFGRDAAIAFTRGAMLITFLDLQGKDSPTEMAARIASFRWTAEPVEGGVYSE